MNYSLPSSGAVIELRDYRSFRSLHFGPSRLVLNLFVYNTKCEAQVWLLLKFTAVGNRRKKIVIPILPSLHTRFTILCVLN